ncbi:SCO family protein [Brevibacillus humidisoli]|uniref:SCO family protein n=1 Tax=Brevibacillus humidisoli TaxID=2895522 RepID=UPI001E44D097|nr:SCO family protein [Brevibacillus humidisoli]UFJ42584.1 SCO family protein [Brevibacillus humidisoli]
MTVKHHISRARKQTDALILLAAVALIGLLAYWLWWGVQGAKQRITLPDITLTTIDGEAYRLKQQAGPIRLLSFIYTRCPDICPATTIKMVELQQQLRKEGIFGKQAEFVTITIDPLNDTPDVLRKYAQALEIDTDGWAILRGSEDETSQITDAFQFYTEKLESGLVAHSSITYLIDQQNHIYKTYGMGGDFDPEQVRNDMENLIKEGSEQ